MNSQSVLWMFLPEFETSTVRKRIRICTTWGYLVGIATVLIHNKKTGEIFVELSNRIDAKPIKISTENCSGNPNPNN